MTEMEVGGNGGRLHAVEAEDAGGPGGQTSGCVGAGGGGVGGVTGGAQAAGPAAGVPLAAPQPARHTAGDAGHHASDGAKSVNGCAGGGVGATPAAVAAAGAAVGGAAPSAGRRASDGEQRRMVDITRDKPIKVTVRVVVPVRDHPKFNFVGKLLGPKGNSLKRLQEDTMTKMAILGRGSMRDKHKEEELRCSGDPKFSHLSDDLHVEITAFAPPAEAHARIAYALAEVRRFLVPDYNDEIRQEQMWEMQILNTAMQRRPLLAAASPASSESPPGSLSPGSPPPATAAQPGGRHAAASPPPPQQQPAPPQQQQPPPPQQQPPPPQQVSAQAPLLHPALRGLEPAAAGVATGAAGVVAVAGGAQAAASAAAAAAAAVVAQQQQQQQAAAATAGGGVAGAPLVGRKRPLLPGGGRPAMSPTKRTVLSILARARAAQGKDLPDYLHPANGRSAGIPVLREDIIPGGGLV